MTRRGALDKARSRRDEYFPAADVTDDLSVLLQRDDIAVVDIATHVAGRAQLIEAAIRAGKHVLTQKRVRSRPRRRVAVDRARP